MIAKNANFWGSNTGSTQRGDGLFFVIWNERSQRKISSKAGYHISIYSMTKPITSVAAMMLMESGQCAELDQNRLAIIFQNWRHEEPVYGQSKRKSNVHNMTVLQLMNHTSGLTYGFFSNTPVDKMYRRSQPLLSQNNQKMIEKLAEIPLLYPPNQKWHYSIAQMYWGI